MICYAGLSNCCLAPAKLKEQFQKVHGDRKYWNTTLAEFKMKRARFDENAILPVFSFVLIDIPILTASYEVAYLIAKQGKLHTISEKLVKPAVLKKQISYLEKQPKISHLEFLFLMAPLGKKLISLKFIRSSGKNQQVKL